MSAPEQQQDLARDVQNEDQFVDDEQTLVIDKTVQDFSDDDDEDDDADADLLAQQYAMDDDGADAAEGDYDMEDDVADVDLDDYVLGVQDDGEGDDDRQHEYDENIIDNAQNTLKHHTDSVFTITYDPASNILISGAADDSCAFFDVKNNQVLYTLNDFTDSVVKTQLSPKYAGVDGTPAQYLVVAAMDGAIRIYNSADLAQLKEQQQQQGYELPLYCEFNTEQDLDTVVFHPKLPFIAAGCADGQVWLFDLITQTPKIFFGHNDSITALFFTNDGKSLVSGSQDGQIIVNCIEPNVKKEQIKYDKIGSAANPIITVTQHPQSTAMCIGTITGALATGQVDHWKQQITKDNAHQDSIESIKFLYLNPHTLWMYTSSVDGTLTAWDYASMSPRYTITLDYAVTLFQFHPTLPLLCVASHDGVLRIYNVESGAIIHEFTGHQDAILDMVVTENTIFTSSDDRTIKTWDLSQLPEDKMAVIRAEQEKKKAQSQQAAQQVVRPGQVVGARQRLPVTRPPVQKPQAKPQ